MSTLTKKQKEIYDYVKKYIEKKEYSPTFEEIKKHFKLSALSGVHQHIDALVKKEMLKKNVHSARGLELKKDEMVKVPLLGIIAAGQPIEAIQEREAIAVPKTRLPVLGNFYALQVNGDSMVDEDIDDGDIVIVKKQEGADTGDKVVALIDNNKVTLKKIYKEKGKIRLQPANPEMSPIFVEPENLMLQGVVIDVIKNVEMEEEQEVKIEPVISQNEKESRLEKWTNTIQCMDCVEGMRYLPDNSVDLIVTSPPYDKVRDYNGFSYDLHAAGREIYRILKEGGMAVMVIQDQTKDFGKTLTSFRTITDWCDNIGFKLFETVIYKKHGAEGAWWTKRFRVDHEYIPVFLKGKRPQFFNKEHLKIPSKHGGKTMTGCATRLTNGKTLNSKKVKINPLKCRGTIWDYTTCGDGSRLKHEHPATFPDKIPRDFIRCFCPENGIVLDPFIGSGTTALAAIELERNYIGFDISKDYCDLAKKRIKETQKEIRNPVKTFDFKKNKPIKAQEIKKYLNTVFPGDIMKLLKKLPDKSVDMIFGDPDYNVGIKYGDKTYTKNFKEYIDWYIELTRESMRVLKDDGNLFTMNYPKQNAHLRAKYLDNEYPLITENVWVYNSNVGHSPKRFTTAHRTILHVRKSKNNKFYKENVALPYKNPTDKRILENLKNGSKGRMPYSWFYFDLVKNVSKEKTYHACQIPQKLTEMLISSCTKPDDIVLILFGGSGAELEICKKLNRQYISAEIDPKYHEIIIDRLKNGYIKPQYKLQTKKEKKEDTSRLPLFKEKTNKGE